MATGAVRQGGRDHPALALGFGPGLQWEGKHGFDLPRGGDSAPVLAACPSPLLSLEGFWPVAAWFDRGRGLRDN